MPDFQTWASQVRQLAGALAELDPIAAAVGVPSPREHDWHELLRLKLLAQLDLEALLVVGIVGGTNIGKSMLFNHLAGEVASAVSPLAAGTKHPVCLVPPGMDRPDLLERLFDGFELRAWQSADDPLGESDADLLFWRVGRNVPPRLLLLDAPDVDSDATVNWHRARAIRQAADVLVAVLTQQKYNDAVVKQFFREAAQADKPIIVLFNQVDLELDRPYWPQWLATFCSQTGAAPELVYAIPLDRQAAGELRLPFYFIGRDGRQPPGSPSSLREELARLHFDAIKIRTFRGALERVLDARHGAPAYLDEIRRAAGEFSAAGAALSASEMARVAWPSLPTGIVVDEIRDWWDSTRSDWARSIHGFYRSLGRPIRAAISSLRSQPDPLAAFHREEQAAILTAVEKMLDELDRLSQVGNETLKPRLLELLRGNARESLLARIRAAHATLPAVDDDYRRFLRHELDAWRGENPGAVRLLRSLDQAAAVARPAITVVLAFTGWGLASDLVGHAAGHLVAETAITGGVTATGEVAVSAAGEGVGQTAARLFRRLQDRYAQQRAEWLARWLEAELLGGLLSDLRRGAEAPRSAAFQRAEHWLAELAQTSRL